MDRHNAEITAFHVDRDSNETDANHNTFERHNAEIAAFHLDSSVKAEWETDNTHCEKVKQMKPYDKPHLLLDLIDTHVFDFLIGHLSRHDLYYFNKIGESQIILIDNGRGFGYSGTDFKRLLAPIQQCCRIRKSTLLKLIKLYRGPDKLSVLFEVSLQVDPISPILTSGHLQALDRRVVQVLKTVARSIIDKGLSINTVVYEDI